MDQRSLEGLLDEIEGLPENARKKAFALLEKIPSPMRKEGKEFIFLNGVYAFTYKTPRDSNGEESTEVDSMTPISAYLFACGENLEGKFVTPVGEAVIEGQFTKDGTRMDLRGGYSGYSGHSQALRISLIKRNERIWEGFYVTEEEREHDPNHLVVCPVRCTLISP